MGSEPAGSHDPLADALADLRDEHPRVPNEAADRYWLRMGLGLGLRETGRAEPLLERLEAAIGVAPAPALAAEQDGGREGETADDAGREEVPVRSLLLARSARLPAVDKEAFDPEAVFGWAARLAPDEIRAMGSVLGDMLAEGLTPDLAKGFAITWRAGLKLPESDFDALFHAFTELELTVCGVLAGYELRTDSRAPKQGLLGGMLGSLLLRNDTRASEAGAILERSGVAARRGLVAMWNAWAAIRFRPQLPATLFEQLVRPWVTAVGRLPEP